MSFVKFSIRNRSSDESGRSRFAKIAHIESDMPNLSTNELALITHALSAQGGRLEVNEQSGFDYTLDLTLG